MFDFNTKKDILKRLRRKGSENVLMRILCAAAAVFVKLWYGVVCGIGMAFSDKNGNFLGIKAPERQSKVRRQDDIVYVKKPFIGRVLSVVLAAAFVLMIAPELSIDLGVRASAANVTGSIPVGGKEYVYDPNNVVGGDNYYLKSDYEAAESYSINESLIDYQIGYGTVRVTWTLGDLNIELIDNVYIELVDTASGKVLESDTVRKDASEYPFKDIGDSTSVRVRIAPTTLIDVYKYTPASTTEGDSREESMSLNRRKAFAVNGQPSTKEIGKLDATFDAPTLKIVNENSGLEIDDCSLADCNNGKIMLRWDEVPQKGGAASDLGKPATGYVIYRYDVTNNTFAPPIDAGNTLNYAVNNVTPGVHYQYFIEAYRNVWGGTGYNQNNDGIISSSKDQIKSNPLTKKNIIYSNKCQNLYIAPPTPDLKIDDTNPKDKSIKVSWDSTKGNYAGVDVYRSIGRIDPDKIPEVKDGTISFREWLEQQAEYSSDDYTDYKIVKIGDFAKPGTKVYTGKIDGDSTVAEGVQYYYYAIAYTQKDNLSYIYGVPAIKPAKLELKLNRPQLTATKGDGEVNLSWTAVEGADGYDVEIIQKSKYDPVKKEVVALATPITSTYKQIEKTFLKLDGLYNGEQYTYKVTPYVWIETKDGDIPYYGDPSDPRTVTVGLGLDRPENLVADGSKDGQMTIKWNPVPNATGYTLYYKNTSDETQTKFKEISTQKPTYTQTNLNNGDVYEYYVIAYKNVNINGEDGIQITYSEESEHAVAKVGIALGTPQDLKTTTKDGEITVTWTPVAGANGYKLHYKNVTKGTSGEFEVTKPPFTQTGLQNGDVYEYYVTPYKTMPGTGKDIPGPTSLTVTQMVGVVLDTPKDFTADTKDGTVNLKWTAVKGAEGYIVYASSGGQYHQFDVSKTTYSHTGLDNGSTWSYRVAAYKTVNGTRTYSTPSETKTVSVGVSLNSAVDLTATAGNRQIDLKWTAVNGAEGYVVYLYNSKTMEFDPITATSKTNYSHVGLKNGKQYTYMVAPYKNIDGKRYYGDYSMSVTAIPTTGSITDMDHELKVKGTSPYGISHGEYISAVSNHGAFDESVDVYFTTNRESTKAVKDVLKNYADGLSSFIVYPFDISIYKENTFIKVDPADGYFVTITMPIPDRLIAYRDYITVIHINENAADSGDITEITLADDWLRSDDQRLEVLPCAVVDIDNVWCIQFKCTNFSPYALVIYKEHISDISTGGGILDGGFAGTFNSGVLLFTALPDIMPNTRRLRIVQDGAKRYRIKRIDRI